MISFYATFTSVGNVTWKMNTLNYSNPSTVNINIHNYIDECTHSSYALINRISFYLHKKTITTVMLYSVLFSCHKKNLWMCACPYQMVAKRYGSLYLHISKQSYLLTYYPKA